MSRRSLIAAALLLAACAKTETADQMATRMQAETDSARTTIQALGTSYTAHWNAHHADSVAAMFTSDGVIMPPNSPAVQGHDSINAFVARTTPPGATLAVHSIDIAASGTLAVDRGSYTFSMPAQGRTPAVSSTGKYINSLRKVNGTWLIAAQIWSDDVPAAAMPAAPGPRK